MCSSDLLRQQVIPDNRGGAGGLIATEAAARSAPDGYTLMFGTSAGMVIVPLINSKVGYDPVKDFDPVSLIVTNPQVLVANLALKVNTVKELIDAAKKAPGKIFYASAGIGAPNHVATEWFKSLVGVNMVHVPFKGQSVPDLLDDRVQILFNTIPGLLPFIKAGKLKALAVSASRRLEILPDTPTFNEQGFNVETASFYGLAGPAKLPQPIVNKMHDEIVKILRTPDEIRRLAENGAFPVGDTPAQFAAFMKKEVDFWAPVIKENNIRPD